VFALANDFKAGFGQRPFGLLFCPMPGAAASDRHFLAVDAGFESLLHQTDRLQVFIDGYADVLHGFFAGGALADTAW
jgi:hypothetical protein